MPKSVTLAEAKAHLSVPISEAEQGAEFDITRHGRVGAARIIGAPKGVARTAGDWGWRGRHDRSVLAPMSEAGKVAMSTGDVFVCPIIIWEISRKISFGKLERPAPPGFNGSLPAWVRHAGYRVLPLTSDMCERTNALPMHHKDPMDRTLIAAALDRGLTIVTDGDMFARYEVPTIW